MFKVAKRDVEFMNTIMLRNVPEFVIRGHYQ